jgi:hypothetical protein
VICLDQCALRHGEEKKMNEGRTVLILWPDDGGHVYSVGENVDVCVCVCGSVCFVLKCI